MSVEQRIGEIVSELDTLCSDMEQEEFGKPGFRTARLRLQVARFEADLALRGLQEEPEPAAESDGQLKAF